MADRDAMLEDAKKALNTPSGMVRLPATAVLEVLARESMLAKGLVQIVRQDYPAEAGNAETWAEEVLRYPPVVLGDAETSDTEGGPT